MSDNSKDGEQPPRAGKMGRPSFFLGIVGGILVGAIFGNVGAGLAIGISLWLIGGLLAKKGEADRQDR